MKTIFKKWTRRLHEKKNHFNISKYIAFCSGDIQVFKWFLGILERDFLSKDRLNWGKYEMLKINFDGFGKLKFEAKN